MHAPCAPRPAVRVPQLVLAKKMLLQLVKEAVAFDALPATPLDHLINELGNAGFEVAEMTGRKERLVVDAEGQVGVHTCRGHPPDCLAGIHVRAGPARRLGHACLMAVASSRT